MKRAKPIRCDRILERHPALGCTEVALSHTEDGDMVAIELITAKEDGTYARDWVTGMFPRRQRAKLARRLSDVHSGVVASRRAWPRNRPEICLMAKSDNEGRVYLAIDEAVDGQTVWLDGGFTCRQPGAVTLHVGSPSGPYFECEEGEHFLDGQDDGDGFAVGVYAADPGPLKWQQGEAA